MARPVNQNKDAALKTMVVEVLSNCNLKGKIDREVSLQIDQTDPNSLDSDIEVDVVCCFEEKGERTLLIFECEDSQHASGLQKEYTSKVGLKTKILGGSTRIKVLSSKDGIIKDGDFKNIEHVAICFVYGKHFSPDSLKKATKEGLRHKVLVWGFNAIKYYKKISDTLGVWTKYELFRELGLDFEQELTTNLSALTLKQKDQAGMYLATIHPGLLLQIGYVVRRTSGKSLAYQRMLNKQRVEEISSFISSPDSHALLPNTVIIVFDSDAEIQNKIKYSKDKKQLTIPIKYASAWIIDGQHRVYGFSRTKYQVWGDSSQEKFDLPVVVFQKLNEKDQTRTFIDINYNQKKIKTDLLCDLATVTRDISNPLTWVSVIGISLNDDNNSPLKGKIKIKEFDEGTLSLSSLVKYGLLETLLGYKGRSKTYSGRLYTYAPFNLKEETDSSTNAAALSKQLALLKRFFLAVHQNTKNLNEEKDPWINQKKHSLLRPTGVNALLLVLAKIMEKYPSVDFDLEKYLVPLKKVNFKREAVAKMGTGWQGFRGFANLMIKEINKKQPKTKRLKLYGEKDKF